ncbi:MAG: hypothetical protein PHI98_17200, partial [Eubacteriales bacterium]|nr:hypothetical protein [Eubacteriales bacterium]
LVGSMRSYRGNKMLERVSEANRATEPPMAANGEAQNPKGIGPLERVSEANRATEPPMAANGEAQNPKGIGPLESLTGENGGQTASPNTEKTVIETQMPSLNTQNPSFDTKTASLNTEKPLADTQAPNAQTPSKVEESQWKIVEPANQDGDTRARQEATGGHDSVLAGKAARLNTGSGSADITLSGIAAVKDGTVYLATDDGGTVRAKDVHTGTEMDALLSSEEAGQLDALGVESMISGYDASKATTAQYVNAYGGVYARAKVGIGYQQAALNSETAQRYMTESARTDAWAAGDRAAAKQKPVFSIKEEHGEKFVEVDTDQDLFGGLTPNETMKKAKEYIIEHFKGKSIGKGEVNAYVSGRTAKEYSRPANSRLTDEIKITKGKAATELENLLTVSRFLEHKSDDGHHPEAVNGWDYYETTFRINGDLYTGKVAVLNGDGFKILHDITQIKKPSDVHAGLPRQSLGSRSSDDNTSIPKNMQKSNGVTEKYSQAAFEHLSTYKRQSLRQSERVLDAFGKKYGLSIRFVDSIKAGKDANGQGRYANGRYDPKTGTIDIALDAVDGAYVYVGMHEAVHSLRDGNPEAYELLRDTVTDALLANGEDVDARLNELKKLGYDADTAMEELVANTTPVILTNPETVQKVVSEDKTLLQKIMEKIGEIADFFDEQLAKLKQRGSWKQMAVLENDLDSLRKIERALLDGLEEKRLVSETVKNTGGVKMSVKESFATDYDAWAKDKTQEKTINVGTTPQTLVDLGAKNQTVVMHSADINHALRHDGMTDEIMKQIPQMMENPIIVMKSSQLGDKNNHQASRVVMYGNVEDENGVPVIAVLELRERQKGGQILDMQLVKNAYGKDSRLDIQVKNSEILYLDPDKKRTNSWLQGLGLQLPSDATNYGSIGSISYPNGFVKMDGVRYETRAFNT